MWKGCDKSNKIYLYIQFSKSYIKKYFHVKSEINIEQIGGDKSDVKKICVYRWFSRIVT